MPKYEYRVRDIDTASAERHEDVLQEHGEKGWELVSVIPLEGNHGEWNTATTRVQLYLKRLLTGVS